MEIYKLKGSMRRNNLLIIRDNRSNNSSKSNKWLTFGEVNNKKYKGTLSSNWNIRYFTKINEKNIIIKNIKHAEMNIDTLFKIINNWEMMASRIGTPKNRFLGELAVQLDSIIEGQAKNKKCLVFPKSNGITIITYDGHVIETPLSEHLLNKFIFKKSDIKLKNK